MLYQGQIIYNYAVLKCQNLTNEKFCDECVNNLCQCGQIKYDGHTCGKFNCLNFRDRFRCNNSTDNVNKICGNCGECFSHSGQLVKFGNTNFRAFHLYLRSFDWDQKFLNSIFYGLDDDQRLNLLLYDKFNIDINNCRRLVFYRDLEYKLVERYFLLKQIIINDLIFCLMFPNLAQRSPANVWARYFGDQLFGSVCDKYVEQANNLIDTIIANDTDIKLKIEFINYMARKGYRTLDQAPDYKYNLINDIKEIKPILKNITEVRTKNFVYALTGIDLF